MAKRPKRSSDVIDTVAVAAGRALGQATGTIDSLRARHPRPVAEARAALASSVEKITALVSQASAQKTAAAARRAVQRAKDAAGLARRRAAGMATKAGRTVKKAVKLSQKTAQQARKSVARPPKALRAVELPAPAKRKAPKGAGVAAVRASQAAHMQRRQTHASSRGRRRQARRDAKG